MWRDGLGVSFGVRGLENRADGRRGESRGNIMVIRTTAITHTLVAPAIHSTRRVRVLWSSTCYLFSHSLTQRSH